MLVHVRVKVSGGVPAAALVAVRDDDRHRRPIEFVAWKPRKIQGYFGRSCVSTG